MQLLRDRPAILVVDREAEIELCNRPADELLAAYKEAAHKIEPQLKKVFGRLPTIPFEVRPIPEAAPVTRATLPVTRPAARAAAAAIFRRYASTSQSSMPL